MNFKMKRLVRLESCDKQRTKLLMVTGLEDAKTKARERLLFGAEDEISIVESETGAEVEDDECFFRLDKDTVFTVVNETRGETWQRPPVLSWKGVEGLCQSSPNQEVNVTFNIVNHIQNSNENKAHQIQIGNNNPKQVSESGRRLKREPLKILRRRTTSNGRCGLKTKRLKKDF